MDVKIIETPLESRVVMIRTDESLSLRSCAAFQNAEKLAVDPRVSSIVVDLGRTQSLFDSGVAMMLNLSKHTGHLNNKIRLINGNSKVNQQLKESPLGALVKIDESPDLQYTFSADTSVHMDSSL